MKEKLKLKSGITLIALVITIIILLILAGVAIGQLTKNGLLEKVQLAREKSNESEARELLITKIYEYQINEISKNIKPTLERLKEYYKKDEEIEYIDLYIKEENFRQVQEGEKATHAKVKLKSYNYEFILDNNLEIMGIDEMIEESSKYQEMINSELKELLKETNMTITLEDIINTPEIMNNLNGLIPKLTANDVKRDVINEIVTYTDNKGGVTRTNSENGSYYAYYAFDEDANTYALSKEGNAKDYYIEYQFPQEYIVFQTKIQLSNGSSTVGQRLISIQGYNEEKNEWEDLTEDLLYQGNNIFKEETQNLNYSKSYKRYRLYVKGLGNSTGYGDDISGLWDMQLYGVLKANVEDDLSEEELIHLLLSNSNIDDITLEQMVTNEDFTKRLIDSLSVDTITNNEILMANLPALIPRLTSNDVIRSEIEGIVTYTDNKGGVTRTNSEYGSNYAYYAFDGDTNTHALSKVGNAKDYYIEYQFPQEYIVFQTKIQLSNGSSTVGQRLISIQGYNEEKDEWEDLTDDLLYQGNNIFKEETQNLNYSKSYKRYRLYVKGLGNSTGYGDDISGLWNMQLYGKLAN